MTRKKTRQLLDDRMRDIDNIFTNLSLTRHDLGNFDICVDDKRIKPEKLDKYLSGLEARLIKITAAVKSIHDKTLDVAERLIPIEGMASK